MLGKRKVGEVWKHKIVHSERSRGRQREREKKEYAQFQKRNAKNTLTLCVDIKMMFYRDTVCISKRKKKELIEIINDTRKGSYRVVENWNCWAFFIWFVFINTSQTSQPAWLPLQRNSVVKVANWFKTGKSRRYCQYNETKRRMQNSEYQRLAEKNNTLTLNKY